MAAEELMLWYLGFAIAGAVVVVVAVLLLAIIFQCRRIVRLAGTAVVVVREIDHNTRPIWSLNATNKVAGGLLDGAKAINKNAGLIVDALTKGSQDKVA